MAHRTHALLALLAIIALALPWNTLCLQLPDAEAEFLYNFWEQNPNARFPTNWQSARTYWACDENWEGVTCEDFGTYYRIVALELDGFAFGGTISPRIRDLTYLDTLTLANLGLIGTIPSELTQLPLQYLDLQNNQLNGSVPSSIWSKTWSTLNLERNQLTGALPNFPSTSLTWTQLFLSSNRFYGTISSTIANLQSVAQLALDSNNLTGTLPPEIFSLPSMYSLDVSDNALSGEIPSFNNGALELVIVDLSNNNFTGSIPDMSGCPSLTSVNLGLNGLTGTIPEAVTLITTLASFVVRENQLEGFLPSGLTSMVNITLWDISYNQIQGTIPPLLTNLPILSHFAIGHNDFDGTIPLELCLLRNVSYININNNRISGSLPACLGRLAELTSFYADFNQIDGSIPATLGNLTELTLLSLSGNKLTGTIPKELANATNLETLLLGSNQLSADIPIELSNLLKLSTLDLSSNQLVGPFPYTIGTLPGLKQLQIADNNLTCPLGSFFNTLLEACDASNNFMCGGETNSLFSPTCALYFAPTCKLTECRRKTRPIQSSLFTADGPSAGYTISVNPGMPSASVVVPNANLKSTGSLSIELIELNENLMDSPSDILSHKSVVLNSIPIRNIVWKNFWNPVTTPANSGGQMWTYTADVPLLKATLTISLVYLSNADNVYVYNVSMPMASGGLKITVSAEHWNLITRPAISKTWATSCVFRVSFGSDRATLSAPTSFAEYPGLPSAYALTTADSKLSGSIRSVPVGQYGDPGRLSSSVYLVYNTSGDQNAAQSGQANSFLMSTFFVIPSDGNATFSYDMFVEMSPPPPPPKKPQLLGSNVGFAFLIIFIVLIVALAIFAVVMWRLPRLRREVLPCLGRAADPVEYF